MHIVQKKKKTGKEMTRKKNITAYLEYSQLYLLPLQYKMWLLLVLWGLNEYLIANLLKGIKTDKHDEDTSL